MKGFSRGFGPGGSDGTSSRDDRHGGVHRPTAHRAADQAEVSADPEDIDTDVGYRKPPSEHRWPKGHSGNPAGRKKGSKNKRTIIIRLMEEKLGRKIQDASKLTRYEALLVKGIQKALGGDTKAMAFILRRYDDAAEKQSVTTHTAGEQDEVVYAALVEKIKRELRESG